MRSSIVAGLLVIAAAGTARAHFALVAPPAYSTQDSYGMPEKSAPCGQADPGTPLVPTNAVTTVDAGSTITITVDEKIFHPGHYRVALADDLASLPADPKVTADASSPRGSAELQTSSTPGVIADGLLVHTSAFTTPQSVQVTLPAGRTCTSCTLQVVEFMSDHALNTPGGCFYHHCATLKIVPAGSGSGTGSAGDHDGAPSGGATGGCDARGAGAGSGALAAIALVLLARRRRR
jgi:MYXO-CTERM domain-containing protein